MANRDEDDEQLGLDDTFDDVKAAYAELVAKKDDGGGDDKAPPQEKAVPADSAPVEKVPAVDAAAVPATAEPAPPADAPPGSWSAQAKTAWANLPKEVKADIARRETEVAQGFAQLKEFKDLRPYAEKAAKTGHTLATAVKYYDDMETLLKQDIGAGVAQIVQNCGLDRQKAAALFAGLAQKFGGTAQPAAGPNDPLRSILEPFLNPLQQEIAGLKSNLTSREVADRNASTQSLEKAIATFAGSAENGHFSALESTIVRLFETGMVPLTGDHAKDLRTAYDTAAQMVPEVREALIEKRAGEQLAVKQQKEREEAAKKKAASKSLNGSKTPGAVTQRRQEGRGSGDDVEADVRAAMSALRQA